LQDKSKNSNGRQKEKAINVQTAAMALYEEEETKTLEVNPWSTLSQS
jgi:hypothetical protein